MIILPQIGTIQPCLGENSQLGSFSLGREREEYNTCLTFCFLAGLFKGLVFVSPHRKKTDGITILWISGHSVQKTAKYLNGAPENLQYCRQIPREENILSSQKRNWQISPIEKLHPQAQRRHIHRKGLRGPEKL